MRIGDINHKKNHSIDKVLNGIVLSKEVFYSNVFELSQIPWRLQPASTFISSPF